MADKVAIISVDGHVKPPRQEYRTYLDPTHRAAYDEVVRATEQTPDGFVHPGIGETSQWDVSQRLADLETQGVVAEVLFSNGQPFAEPASDRSIDPATTKASYTAYNRWLVDFCAQAPTRLHGLAAVSFDDVPQAVTDVQWAKEQGFVGIAMPPLHLGGPYFFDPALDPIWAACQEAGLVLCQHGGTGSPEYAPKSFASFMVLAAEHWFFSSRSLWQLILGGVFERFPQLKLAMIETEQWWIGPVFDLLDGRETKGDDWSEFAETLGRLKPYRRLPSEYWSDNCFAGLSPFLSDQLPPQTGRPGFTLAPANAMIGIDYPHPETTFPGSLREVKRLVERDDLTRDDVLRVLHGNAASVFGIDLQELAPVIDRIGVDLDAIPEVPVAERQATSLFDVVKLAGKDTGE